MKLTIDIDIDWNEEDESGLPWTFVDRAAHPQELVPGVYVVAGRGSAIAIAEVVDVSESGVVHLRPVPGNISSNAHLLAPSLPA